MKITKTTTIAVVLLAVALLRNPGNCLANGPMPAQHFGAQSSADLSGAQGEPTPTTTANSNMLASASSSAPASTGSAETALGGTGPSLNMGRYGTFFFYADRPGNAAAIWMQPGGGPPNPWDEFWFDNSGNFNLPGGLSTPGPVSMGANYLTANTLGELTADANFPGTVYLSSPVTLTANLTLTCDLRPLNGAVITLGNYNLALNGTYQAGLYQTFNKNGSGSVSFARTPPGGYLPEWWGMPDNGSDDGTNQEKVNCAKAAAESTHGTLVFTSGIEYALPTFQIDQGNWQVSAWGAKIIHDGSSPSPITGTNDLIVASPTSPGGSGVGAVSDFHWFGGYLIAKQSSANPTNALLWVSSFWNSDFKFEGMQCGNAWPVNSFLRPTANYAAYGIYITGATAAGSSGVYYDSFYPGYIAGATADGIFLTSPNPNQSTVNNDSFYDARLQFNATGVRVQCGTANSFYQMDAESNTSYAIQLDSTSSATAFYGAWIEANNGGEKAQQTLNNSYNNDAIFMGSDSETLLSASNMSHWAIFSSQGSGGKSSTYMPNITSLNIIDAGACTMTAGACGAQTLNHSYATAPFCFANWTGSGTLSGTIKVPVALNSGTGCIASGTPWSCCTGGGTGTCTQVTPSSSSTSDMAVVNWFCLGN